jgi:serine/threonine protein kinase
MTAGFPPFRGSGTMETYEKIVAGKYRHMSHFSTELRNLIENVLQADLTRRYGVLKDGVNDVKRHAWFRSTDWLGLLNKQVRAPYVPFCDSLEELSKRTEQIDDLKNSASDKFRDEFIDF